jgi:pyridoxal phosphate enzyme (YggS family)
MNTPTERIKLVLNRIEKACTAAGRHPSEVSLLVVSKRHPAEKIELVSQSGIYSFGENQLQEALGKQQELQHLDLQWHFIGAIQSNKTRAIAEHFQWVQSVDREKILRRLDSQRPPHTAPLNICLQVNIDYEPQKGGAEPDEILNLAALAASLPQIRLRGLMAIPKNSDDINQQCDSFRRVKELFERVRSAGYAIDTLSMGMSSDLEAAILEGSTMVRVGTDIFGAREF